MQIRKGEKEGETNRTERIEKRRGRERRRGWEEKKGGRKERSRPMMMTT